MNLDLSPSKAFIAVELMDKFEELVAQFSSIGLSVHIIKEKTVLTPTATEFFKVVDGEEALQYVNNPEFSDVMIKFGSETYYCHKEYLVQRCEYFQALFKSNYQESSQDILEIELPAPGNFEGILKFLYSGIAQENSFEGEEIFRTVVNSTFLGIPELVSKAVNAFAAKWKTSIKSEYFRRSYLDAEFISSVLEHGTNTNHFQGGDKLRIVVQWSKDREADLTEARNLLWKHECLQQATISDLEWALETNTALFSVIEHSHLRAVYRRALKDDDNSKKQIRAAEEKTRGLLECVRVLTIQLEEVRCIRCRLFLPRASLKTRTCVMTKHAGNYIINEGWTCCGNIRKRSRGCKPISVSKHTSRNISSSINGRLVSNRN